MANNFRKSHFKKLIEMVMILLYLLEIVCSEKQYRRFGAHTNKNDKRIIPDVTKLIGSNGVLENNTKLAYVFVEGNLTDELSWSETACRLTYLGQFASLSNYKFSTFSIMFPIHHYDHFKTILTMSDNNKRLNSLIETYKSSISFLIFQPEYELDDHCKCFWENRNYQLKSDDNHYDNLLSLGMEYGDRLIECCSSYNFDILQIVDFTILQVRFYPYSQLLSYGLFSYYLDRALVKNREFVRNFNSNCTMYLRLLYFDEGIDNQEINYRYKALFAMYINAWLDETKSEEHFIIDVYPLDIVLPENLEILQSYITPRFSPASGFRNKETLSPTTNLCKSSIVSGENKHMISELSKSFNSLQFSGKDLMCDSSYFAAEEKTSFNFKSTSIIFDYVENDSERLLRYLEKLTEKNSHLNLHAVYFLSLYGNRQGSTWNATLSMLHTKNITVGGYMKLRGYNESTFNNTLKSLPEIMGPMWNIASEILVELVNLDTPYNMSKTLFSFDKARRSFEQIHRNKHLVPLIITQSKQLATQRQVGGHLIWELNIQQSSTVENQIHSLYCDDYTRMVNECYDGIVTFANINGWKKLFMLHAVSTEEATGWWLNVETNPDYIDRNKTQYPLLVRSNGRKPMRKEHQLPKTFKCITWTRKSLDTGIQFHKNQYIGTTVQISIKNGLLTKRELQTMLLFAFGKFSCVELTINTKSDFDLFTSAILNERFLNVVRTGNKTLVYVEMPLVLISQIELKNWVSREVAFHFSGLEKYTNQIKRDADLKSVGRMKSAKTRFGLTIMNCGNEVNSNFSVLKSISIISQIDYIVCHAKPVVPKNRNQTWMAEYVHTFYYIKKYMETFLPKFAGMMKSVEVMFHLNYAEEPKCPVGFRDKTENFLRFLNDVSLHSVSYKTRYFIVQSFENDRSMKSCPSSWWKIIKYDDLSNVSVYVDREEEHFGRLTKLEYQLPPEYFNDETVVVTYNVAEVLLYFVIPVIFLGIIVVLWLYLRRGRKQYLDENEINNFYNGEVNWVDDSNCDFGMLSIPFSSHYEIPKGKIKIVKIIGSGEFGTVSLGLLENNIEVAVKVPKTKRSKELFKTALAEAKILCFLGCQMHPNVVKFIGACTTEIRKGKLQVITEYCSNGSLLNYLRSRHKRCGTGKSLAVELYELYKFAHEIASGMEFISNKRVIHGDLATRNVFLDSDYTCKIGDFGLSRKLYELNEYVKTSQEPLPWRWMSIESLKTMEFTTKSDVWSYGITLWEIFTFGTLPYPGLSWSVDFVADLENGMRMEKAQYASSDVHKEMLHCWNKNANDRPTFTEIVHFFGHKRQNEYIAVLP